MIKRRGLSAALLCALALVVVLVPTASSQISVVRCHTTGLHYTRSNGSTTESVKVRDLEAYNQSTCTEARRVAKVVAKSLLNQKRVPRRINNFTMSVKYPCKACKPIVTVVGRQGAEHVNFKVAGGV